MLRPAQRRMAALLYQHRIIVTSAPTAVERSISDGCASSVLTDMPSSSSVSAWLQALVVN